MRSSQPRSELQVVLPIGTIVTMLLGQENSINVWISPSASDRTPDASGNSAVLGENSLKIQTKLK